MKKSFEEAVREWRECKLEQSTFTLPPILTEVFMEGLNRAIETERYDDLAKNIGLKKTPINAKKTKDEVLQVILTHLINKSAALIASHFNQPLDAPKSQSHSRDNKWLYSPVKLEILSRVAIEAFEDGIRNEQINITSLRRPVSYLYPSVTGSETAIRNARNIIESYQDDVKEILTLFQEALALLQGHQQIDEYVRTLNNIHPYILAQLCFLNWFRQLKNNQGVTIWDVCKEKSEE
ncbi:hypothetical protein AB4392_05165 [Vibrio breoganii]